MKKTKIRPWLPLITAATALAGCGKERPPPTEESQVLRSRDKSLRVVATDPWMEKACPELLAQTYCSQGDIITGVSACLAAQSNGMGSRNACEYSPFACFRTETVDVPCGSKICDAKYQLEEQDPSTLEPSSKLFDFLAEKEGYGEKLYNDFAGHCTIGYGHLVHKGKCDGRESEKSFENGLSRPEAFALKKKDTKKFTDDVRRRIKRKVTQSEFDAILSFTFNLGPGALDRSKVANMINFGSFLRSPSLRVGEVWNKYIKYRNPMTNKLENSNGLLKRRIEESEFFEGKRCK